MVFDSYIKLLADWLHKKKTYRSKTKKNHNSKVWFVLYMQPKVFWSHTCPKPSNISSGVFCGKGSRRKNVIFTLTPWVLYKCYDLKPFLVSCNILGNELILNRNPNLNYPMTRSFGHFEMTLKWLLNDLVIWGHLSLSFVIYSINQI